MIPLLLEDEFQPRDICAVELAIAAARSVWIYQALRLQEANLRNRDIWEVVTQQIDDFTDTQRAVVRHRRVQRQT